MEDKRINDQKNILEKQNYKIESQKNILLLFIAFSILVATLTFFIWRSYSIKNKANIVLEEKNKEIKSANLLLANEKKNTLSSITYAKVQTSSNKKKERDK